jgi:hypothetical protein
VIRVNNRPFSDIICPMSWTLFIAPDVCNDFTFGNDQATTHDNLAEMVNAVLDEMAKTDEEPEDLKIRYTLTTTAEALAFLAKHPRRRDEFFDRCRAGQITISPWLCNTLWGLMSPEMCARGMMAARRLELESGLEFRTGNHSEMPSLPWGVGTLYAACGIEWVVVPWLEYDSALREVTAPPVFNYVGPDGGSVKMVFDQFASSKENYNQGSHLARYPDNVPAWMQHYADIDYPSKNVLAAGAYHDLYRSTPTQIRPLFEKIKALTELYPDLKIVHASFDTFCAAMKGIELPNVSGSFGMTWEGWPQALAKLAIDARRLESNFLNAETLVALVGQSDPSAYDETEASRRCAETNLVMLGDHAWNGLGEENILENVVFRRHWLEEGTISANRTRRRALKNFFKETEERITIFNALGHVRTGLVYLAAAAVDDVFTETYGAIPGQMIQRNGKNTLAFIAPETPGLGVRQDRLVMPVTHVGTLSATTANLTSPHYTALFDPKKLGIQSLVDTKSGTELRLGEKAIGEVLDGVTEKIKWTSVETEVICVGPVLATIRQTAESSDTIVTVDFTVFQTLDQVDIRTQVIKKVARIPERIVQIFPMIREGSIPIIDTPGALTKWAFQPEGDLLPGTDFSRACVQNLVEVEGNGVGISIATPDAFLVRPDLESLTIQVLGNEINAKEVSRDQGGETEFEFRFSIRAHAHEEPIVKALQWAQGIARPLEVWAGAPAHDLPKIEIEPNRALVTSLKPAFHGDAVTLKLSELTGQADLVVTVKGAKKVELCDLVERVLHELPVENNQVTVPIRGWGFAAIRIMY